VPVPGYPDADPLDYEELQGLEEMGESTVRVGKLKLRLDLHQLLDGYEVRENRSYIIPNSEELKESYIEITNFFAPEMIEEDSDVKSDGIGFMAKIKQLLGI
jgi:internalin A